LGRTQTEPRQTKPRLSNAEVNVDFPEFSNYYADLAEAALFRGTPQAATPPLAPVPIAPHTRHPEKFGYGETMLEDDRIITKAGVRYFPLSLAAELAQVPRQTLLNWIRNETQFEGRTLTIYNSPSAGKLYLAEESLIRVANRFVRWPSNEPAGLVTIGETDDQSGYLSTSHAARVVGTSPRTMWLWASQGKAPTDHPLDVVRCTTSNHFYIRERDVLALKPAVPRSGLQRGRRRQPTPQP